MADKFSLTPIRNILFISDLHFGSTLAPAKRHRLDDGGYYDPSPLQRWLNRCWDDVTGDWFPWLTSDAPTEIIICGDAIDGVHHRATQLITTSIKDQITLAKAMLQPLVEKVERVWVVRGTAAHTGEAGQAEEHLAWELGAQINEETGTSSFVELNREVEGLLIHVTHHVSPASPHTETSALQRELNTEAIEYPDAGYERPNLQVRGHRHRFNYVKTVGNRAIMPLPAWQLKTNWFMSKKPMTVPQIGAVVVKLFEDGWYLPMERIHLPKQAKIYRDGTGRKRGKARKK